MLRIIIILLGVCCICACGMIAPKLERRAADYYSFQIGHLPKAKYSSFLSPAYRAIANPDGLKQLDAAMRKSTSPSERYARISLDQVTVLREGRFGMTTVDTSLGATFRDGKPVRWVRDGRQWYIYLGSDAEVDKYGVFPPSLVANPAEQRRPANAPPLLNKTPEVSSAAPRSAVEGDPGNAANTAGSGEAGAEVEPSPPAAGGGEEPPAEGSNG